tara:strand:+ start:16696 stop:17292 length:597 start_codon:yes stop_codon:yes gene_type:complete
MYDLLVNTFNNLDYSKPSTYIVTAYFLAMVIVVGLNIRDALRIWIVGILFTLSMVDLFVFQPYLPNSLIVHQICYSLSDLTAILLLKYRLRVGHKLSNFLCVHDTTSYIYRAFNDLGYARQEYFIRLIFGFSIAANLTLVAEYVVRHSGILAEKPMFIYNTYPSFKLGLIIALTFALLTMTLDGLVGRRLKVDPFNNG